MSLNIDDKKPLVEETITPGVQEVTPPKKPVNNNKPGLENEVLGTWSVRLRNFCGTLSVITTNIICLMGMFTIHKGVLQGQPWPHWIIVILIVSGPVLVSFSFMNVSKVIQTILHGTEKAADIKAKFIKKLES